MALSVALMMLFASCEEEEDDVLTTLNATQWEGVLTKTKGSKRMHEFKVVVKFYDEHSAQYSYSGGGSTFTYDIQGNQMVVSQARYSNINGTWTIKQMDAHTLLLEKTDGNMFQSFSLSPKTSDDVDAKK